MVKCGISCSTIETMQSRIEIHSAQYREENESGVNIPGHGNVKAVIKRHSAMVQANHTDSFLSYQNGTSLNPLTSWRRKWPCAPPPDWLWQPTLEPIPVPSRNPPAPPCGNLGTPALQNDVVPHGYVYVPTSLLSPECFNLDAFSQNRQHDKDMIPELLTDEKTSTG